MIKYHAVAFALKLFSVCGPTRQVYRYLGNRLGSRKRIQGKVPRYYFNRVRRNIDAIERHNMLGDASRILELGTGWIHWETVTTRLFKSFQADMYDVWDNRQFDVLFTYLGALDRELEAGTLAFPPAQVRSAREKLQELRTCRTFATLYKKYDLNYVLDPEGMMQTLTEGHYELIISAGVFEHLPRETVPEYVKRMAALLKPGGYCILSINITDHLYLYDRTASPKQYVGIGEFIWKILYENGVQYINRLQKSEWMGFFADAGLMVVEQNDESADLGDLTPAEKFKQFEREDLECTTLEVILQRPKCA